MVTSSPNSLAVLMADRLAKYCPDAVNQHDLGLYEELGYEKSGMRRAMVLEAMVMNEHDLMYSEGSKPSHKSLMDLQTASDNVKYWIDRVKRTATAAAIVAHKTAQIVALSDKAPQINVLQVAGVFQQAVAQTLNGASLGPSDVDGLVAEVMDSVNSQLVLESTAGRQGTKITPDADVRGMDDTIPASVSPSKDHMTNEGVFRGVSA